MKVEPREKIDESKYPKLPINTQILVEVERPTEGSKANPEYFEDSYKGGPPSKKVRIRMVAVEQPYAGNGTADSPPARLWASHFRDYTPAKKGVGLRDFVQAALGGRATDQELYDFDLDDLVGKRLIVIGKYKDGATEGKYLEPIVYIPVPPSSSNGAAVATPAAQMPLAEIPATPPTVAAAPAVEPTKAVDINF